MRTIVTRESRFASTRTAGRRCSATRRRPTRCRRRARCWSSCARASLNHLDIWVRKGLPSVPKPRILGADGAGIASPAPASASSSTRGSSTAARIAVVGEHTDGTHAELIAVPAANVYPLPDELSFEEAAAFPLVFETAYRMLVDARAAAARASGCWSGASAAASRRPRSRSRRRSARACSSTSSSDEKLERAHGLGADATVNHDTDDVAARGEGAHRRRRARRRRARRRGDVGDVARRSPRPAAASRSAARRRARTRPRTPPDLVEAADDPRLDDGDARGLRGAPTSSSDRRARSRSIDTVSRSRRSAPRTSASRRATSSARSSSRSR